MRWKSTAESYKAAVLAKRVMGIYTTMYLGPGELNGPDTTARNGWSGLRRSKVFKGEPWRGGGSPSKTGTLATEKFNTLRSAVSSKHNIDFEGVAGAIKFAEFMKRKAEKAKAKDISQNFTTGKRRNKMNIQKYMGSHMTYSGTDYGSSQTYRLS